MGAVIKDRDLLVREPSLFRDVGWVGQRLAKGNASIADTLLTFTGGADVPLDHSGVDQGNVVVIGGAGLEIIERVSATELTVSRPRASESDALVPPTPVSIELATVMTFTPQMAIVHAQTLRMLGIEAGSGVSDGSEPGKVFESSLTDPSALREVETLGTLHLIYTAAAALAGAGTVAEQRAEMYRRRYQEARQRAVVWLDLDGDGRADATRRMNVVQFVR